MKKLSLEARVESLEAIVERMLKRQMVTVEMERRLERQVEYSLEAQHASTVERVKKAKERGGLSA